jgi:hypothetical protein
MSLPIILVPIFGLIATLVSHSDRLGRTVALLVAIFGRDDRSPVTRALEVLKITAPPDSEVEGEDE